MNPILCCSEYLNIFRTAIAHAVTILDAHNRHNLLRLLNLADALDWTVAGLIAKWRQALTPTKFSTIIVMASSMESRARLARYYLLVELSCLQTISWCRAAPLWGEEQQCSVAPSGWEPAA